MFYLGQNEDCRLGDSTSDSSENLLQRGSGRICDLGEEGVHAMKHLSYKRSSASHQGADIIVKAFSAFLDMRK